MPFAASKILGEITFFMKILGQIRNLWKKRYWSWVLRVTVPSTMSPSPPRQAREGFFFGDFGTDKEF